jgi:hypothetical protein
MGDPDRFGGQNNHGRWVSACTLPVSVRAKFLLAHILFARSSDPSAVWEAVYGMRDFTSTQQSVRGAHSTHIPLEVSIGFRSSNDGVYSTNDWRGPQVWAYNRTDVESWILGQSGYSWTPNNTS